MTLRIIFMGTPDFSVPVLSELVAQGHEVIACYTRAPKPAGRRGLELTKSPVHVAAEKFGFLSSRPRACATRKRRNSSPRTRLMSLSSSPMG